MLIKLFIHLFVDFDQSLELEQCPFCSFADFFEGWLPSDCSICLLIESFCDAKRFQK